MTAIRLVPTEAAHILRDRVVAAPRIVQRMSARYFEAGAHSPTEAWEAETIRHPVFVLVARSGSDQEVDVGSGADG